MSEEATNNQEAETAGESVPETEAASPEVAAPSEHTVPVSALQKEREKAQSKIEQLETQLAKIQAAEEERAKAELSEVERAKVEAQEAQARAEALQVQLVQEQRKQVALAAATKAGYRDASDALRYVDLSGDLDAGDIEAAVAQVLEERDYLKAQAPKGPAQTSGVADGAKVEKAEDGADAIGGVLSDAMKFIGR